MEMEAGDRRGCTLSTQLRKRGQEGSNLATMGKTPCEDKGLINFCCSVADSCLTLCDPLDSSMPGFPVLHYLPEFVQTHVHWRCHPIISSSVVPFSSCPPSFPASGSFLMSWFFTSNSQHIGALALASVFPMNI